MPGPRSETHHGPRPPLDVPLQRGGRGEAEWTGTIPPSLPWRFLYDLFNEPPNKEDEMANLKIRFYKSGKADPKATVTIPGTVVKVASKLIPRQAANALHEKGIEIDEILALSENPDVHGTLVEIEEHKKNGKVVISLE